MTTWFKWPPETREEKFPKDFLIGDPLDIYSYIQSACCSECGFTVEWVFTKDTSSDDNFYPNETFKLIQDFLNRQIELGECPVHKNPFSYNEIND